jgi:hypothetical protein
MASAGEISWWIILSVEVKDLSGTVRGTSYQMTSITEFKLSALLD